MLSAVFIYLAGIEQLCSSWLAEPSLFIFIVAALTGLLLLSAFIVVLQWSYRLQQAQVQLQKANEELKQKIDQQQQVEAALRESERRFSSLISNIPGYFYLVVNDPDYTPEFISEKVYEVTGYKQEEYLSERTITFRREVHPEDRDSVWARVQQAIEAKETYECTYRIITKSGEQKWVWERGRGIFDEKGELLSLGGFVTDITERKQTEEQLKEVKSQLELFFSQSLDGFFFMMLDEPVQWDDTVDKEKTLDYVFAHQRITKANQAILKQYGASEEQFLGLTPNDFFAHKLAYGREIWRNFFDRGRLHIETSECKLDNQPIWIEGDYICFYDAQGRITGHFGIQRDITERKEAEEALRKSEERLSLALKAVKAGMWQWRKKQNRVVWSEQTFKLLGYEPNIPIETDQIIAIVRKISDRVLAEKALRESEEKFRHIAENIREIFYLSDLKQSKILYINPAYETIWGRTCQSLYEEPSSFLEAVHPEDRSLVIQSLERQKAGESIRCEYRIIRPDGSVRWVWDRCFPIRDEKGQLYRWCGVVEDITERREAEEQLQHDALHDTLTGLPNRTLLMDRLERLIKRYQRHQEEQFAVLFLDLDRFKVINDSWGHLVGDQLLIALARRLEKCQRDSDTIARIGGDEFVILLEDISSVDDAIQVAERIQHELMLPFILNSHEVFVSASIGITLNSEHYSQPASLLRDADSAMYCAKVRGKARHEVFNPSMHARALKQLTLENKLRRALNSQELVVYYQPIVSLATNLLRGFEALVRWKHPEQGMICPNDFIPLAEETGLIIPLDRLVLQQACHQLRHWKEQFCPHVPLSISVNLSGKQFARPDLIEQIDRILAETGLEGQYLKLEITESVLIENAESTAEILRQLQQRKIQVCLDDFGTGYSSLSYLHRFPINSIKIDRSFVSQGKNNGSNDVIVRAIVTIAHELGIEVIAEGIEKIEQLAFLRSLGCHYGQGYWFSPPRYSKAMEVWLKAVGQERLPESNGILSNYN